MNEQKPIFVKIDQYHDVLDVINSVKGKLAEAKGILKEIDQLRTLEATEVESYKAKVDEVEKKLQYTSLKTFYKFVIFNKTKNTDVNNLYKMYYIFLSLH